MSQQGVSKRAGLRITKRDVQILKALSRFRFLSLPQLHALFFPSRKRTRERLLKLFRGEFVVRVFMPARPYDRKSETIYALGSKGARYLHSQNGGKRPRYLSKREQRTGLFLDHTLRRNDVAICLELMNRYLHGYQLLAWRHKRSEVRGRVELGASNRRSAHFTIVPDGFFSVFWRGHYFAHFLEVDMGTVRIAKMQQRYRGYLRWWSSGRMGERFGQVPTRVLTVTNSSQRLKRLKEAAQASTTPSTRGLGLFWFNEISVAKVEDPERLISGSWVSARNDRRQRLFKE